ncbi:peptide chain release factor N(5)-glutamine methyltransferase [Microvirga lenta]|uniref:peptide chain release factor N(5)-glutamine methyltransferase n=1 Tax=Microvirga lenta TaxID=2881337 RepID=UPI001CFE5A7F|nr:peptide chain release factor N(5)-glutamine methyltransferase [Microvirga lenta]MCB5174360.1 peptide chain release factor N(5)-glutamine methyltransferase [Microvirga lenta]
MASASPSAADWRHFRRQVPIGPYVADFCCLGSRLVIEVDGNQHGFECNAVHDRRRTDYLNGRGFQVIRFANRDVMTAIDDVLDTIRAALGAGIVPCAGGDEEQGSESRSTMSNHSGSRPDTGMSSDRSPSGTTPTPTPPRKGEGKGGQTRAEALAALRRRLTEAGFGTAGLDARLLVLAALGISATDLIARPDTLLTPAEAERLEAFARRRLAHEPVARIVGEREFWGLPFTLSPETLVPRPDTETLIETVLALLPDRQARLRIVDFGTGSGCILTALLHELPHAEGLGIDRSFDALRTARRNAQRNGVGDRSLFAASDWASALQGRFDLIVSNPPYIASPVIPGLDAEVREHDPVLALDGGADGLDAYRILLGEAKRLLVPGGLMVLEIGYDQAEALQRLARAHALEILRVAHDLSSNPRCVALKRS